jgi:carlactone synthase/all-trans-10'-apo-beta-carotenal 13,14-cleaving dioxygenase
VVYREFDTPAEAGSKLEQLAQLAKQLWGLTTNNPAFTDNASVSLSLAGAGAVSSSGSGAGSGGRILLAMSETPAASYLINAEDLSTLQQVSYADGIPGDLTTAHPSVLPDGSLVNFTRSLPFGGFHVYRQDPTTLARTEVRVRCGHRAAGLFSH